MIAQITGDVHLEPVTPLFGHDIDHAREGLSVFGIERTRDCFQLSNSLIIDCDARTAVDGVHHLHAVDHIGDLR